jgi:hypothetical protein
MCTRSTLDTGEKTGPGHCADYATWVLDLVCILAIVGINIAENWNCLIYLSLGEVLQCLRGKGCESWFGFFFWTTGIQENGHDFHIKVAFFYVVKNV